MSRGSHLFTIIILSLIIIYKYNRVNTIVILLDLMSYGSNYGTVAWRAAVVLRGSILIANLVPVSYRSVSHRHRNQESWGSWPPMQSLYK